MLPKELEQTLVLIKPDALKISLTGYILSQLSEFHTGLRFAGAKIVHVSRLLAEVHYAEHREKAFYPGLIEYLTGRVHYPNEPHRRRVMAFVYCGPDAVKKVREFTGPTNPHVGREKAPGTLRTLGTVVPLKDSQGQVVGERIENLIHASSSDTDAEREIKLWFKPNDIMPYMQAYATASAEEHFYFCEGALFTRYQAGSTCLVAPGDTVWRSDLEALQLCAAGCGSGHLDAIVAKYLINERREA